MRILSRAALIALAVAAIGCGGDDPPPDEPDGSLSNLAHYLPVDEPAYVAFADLAASREELGLPAEAAPLPVKVYFGDYDPASPKARLLEVARLTMPTVFRVQPGSQHDPLSDAFDATAISAAVTGGRGPITVIQTTQPFGDLADSLAELGYERDGTLLSKPGAEVSEMVSAGDGVVVLSGERVSAAEAVAEPGGGPPGALELLEPQEGPVGLVTAGVSTDCVTGYGGWQDASGSSGVLRIAVNGTADVDRVQLDTFKRYTRANLGEPTLEGSEIEVPFTGTDGSPLRDFQAGLGLDLYDCE